MTTDQIFCCYSPADKAAAEKLTVVLTNKGFMVYDQTIKHLGIDYEAAWKSDMLRCSAVLVLLSKHGIRDKFLLQQLEFAQQNHIKVIPVVIDTCDVPVTLQQMRLFPVEDLYTKELDYMVEVLQQDFINLSKSVAVGVNAPPTFPRVSAPAPMAMPAPENRPIKKGFFKTILETLKPFSFKNKREEKEYAPMGSSATKVSYERLDTLSDTTERDNTIIGKEPGNYSDLFSVEEDYPLNESYAGEAGNNETYSGPILMAGPPEPSAEAESSAGAEPEFSPLPPTPPQTEFIHVSASIDKPQPLTKGKLLYDIPDAMTVNEPQRCLIRVGASEAIVRDDDTFSPAVKIEAVSISKIMEVDMADISEPAHFNIKKISSNEQLVEDESYTEWIFMVTPLTSGRHPLILKVSIIKLIDGKERRKELVFEKSVTISAAPQENSPPIMSFISNPGTGTLSKSEAPLKDLSGVELIKEMDPPSVFISYAHLDKTYFDIFLQYLQTHSNWSFWTDRNIEIGSDWYQSIEKSIADSDVAVLLISANFLSSNFIKEHEFSNFITLKNKKNDFQFLPIFLRDVEFTRWEELAAMQLFVAYGDEYGVPEKRGQMIPFSKLCRFDNNGLLIPNDNLDTFFKNLVRKAEADWLKQRLRTFSIS